MKTFKDFFTTEDGHSSFLFSIKSPELISLITTDGLSNPNAHFCNDQILFIEHYYDGAYIGTIPDTLENLLEVATCLIKDIFVDVYKTKAELNALDRCVNTAEYLEIIISGAYSNSLDLFKDLLFGSVDDDDDDNDDDDDDDDDDENELEGFFYKGSLYKGKFKYSEDFSSPSHIRGVSESSEQFIEDYFTST